MKNKTKRIITAICLIMTLLFSLMLTSCSDMTSGADNVVKAFIEAIVNDDYETAASLMHPGYSPDAGKLRDGIGNIEETLGVDFSDGVEFESTVGMHVYFAIIHIPLGPMIETTMNYYVTVSGVKLEMQCAVINSFGGSGLTDFLFKNRVIAEL